MPTWDSAAADDLWTRLAGRSAGWEPRKPWTQNIRSRPRRQALAISRRRQKVAGRICPGAAIPATGCLGRIAGDGRAMPKHLFDPNALTLGFARRFATYKRPNLLLHDPAAAASAVDQFPSVRCNSSLPARRTRRTRQGKALIQQWIRFIRQPETRPHAVFLERLRHALDRASGRRAWTSGSTRHGAPGRHVEPAA